MPAALSSGATAFKTGVPPETLSLVLSTGEASMPSGAAESFTPATTSDLAVAAPAGPGHAATAPAKTARATLTPPHTACFRLRRDRFVTVIPAVHGLQRPIQAKSTESSAHEERQDCAPERDASQG